MVGENLVSGSVADTPAVVAVEEKVIATAKTETTRPPLGSKEEGEKINVIRKFKIVRTR